jgi:RNA polymerase sigma factor (TIGR02999 family)
MAGPMDVSDPRDLTQLLQQWRQGDQRAFEILAPRVDAELRRLASRYMRRERPEHTLQPTALVNEAWLRLAGGSQPDYENRSHFVGIAAQHMRHILVEHARRPIWSPWTTASRPLPRSAAGKCRWSSCTISAA